MLLRSLLISLAFALSLSACQSSHIIATRKLKDPNFDLGNTDLEKYARSSVNNYQRIHAIISNPVSLSKANAPTAQWSDSNAALQFTSMGMAWVNDRCARYFTALTAFHKAKSEEVSALGLMTGGAVGIMGAAQSAAKDIAIVGLGGALAGSLLDNFGKGILYELDPSSTQSLVERAMQEYVSNMDSTSIINAGDAMRAVQGYAQLCTIPRIEAMVKEAVATAKPVASTPTSSQELNSKATSAVSKLVSNLSLTQTPSLDTLGYLYWLYHLDGFNDRDMLSHIRGKLPTEIADLIFDKNGELQKGEKLDRLKTDLIAVADADPKLRARAAHLKTGQLSPQVSQQSAVPTFVPPRILINAQ